MAEVKWIKICTDVFDDEKIILIESMPESDSIIVIWFKLLCMAGKQNNSGVFMLNDRLAYTDEMLSTIFRRPLNTVRLALHTFEMYGMIEMIDGTITIPNWEKHQSLDKLEKIRENNRKRVAKYRDKQKLLTAAENDVTLQYKNVTQQSRVDKNRLDKNRVEVDVAVNDGAEDNNGNCSDNGSSNSDNNIINPDDVIKSFKGNVMLSENQIADLLDKLDLEAFNYYIDKLSTFIDEKGAKVRNHYATILKWYNEDSKVHC